MNTSDNHPSLFKKASDGVKGPEHMFELRFGTMPGPRVLLVCCIFLFF